jgi:hypothetical protein
MAEKLCCEFCKEFTPAAPTADDRAIHALAVAILNPLVDRAGRPPGFEPLPDLVGVLTQISNVLATQAPQRPADETKAVRCFHCDEVTGLSDAPCPVCGKTAQSEKAGT